MTKCDSFWRHRV